MLLIWRGLGPVVLAIAVVGIFAGVILGEAVRLGTRGEEVLIGLAMLPAGYAIWRLGKRWNAPTRELIDAATGEKVVLKQGHSMFFIPFEWWGPIFAVLGVLFAVASLLGPAAP
jgi:hypothetical protein